MVSVYGYLCLGRFIHLVSFCIILYRFFVVNILSIWFLSVFLGIIYVIICSFFSVGTSCLLLPYATGLLNIKVLTRQLLCHVVCTFLPPYLYIPPFLPLHVSECSHRSALMFHNIFFSSLTAPLVWAYMFTIVIFAILFFIEYALLWLYKYFAFSVHLPILLLARPLFLLLFFHFVS